MVQAAALRLHVKERLNTGVSGQNVRRAAVFAALTGLLRPTPPTPGIFRENSGAARTPLRRAGSRRFRTLYIHYPTTYRKNRRRGLRAGHGDSRADRKAE